MVGAPPPCRMIARSYAVPVTAVWQTVPARDDAPSTTRRSRAIRAVVFSESSRAPPEAAAVGRCFLGIEPLGKCTVIILWRRLRISSSSPPAQPSRLQFMKAGATPILHLRVAFELARG